MPKKTLKPGDLVKMAPKSKRELRKNGCSSHVNEFSSCIGVVMNLVDYGDNSYGPEFDIRWLPSKLRYAYHPNELIKVNTKLRGKKLKNIYRKLIATIAFYHTFSP